MTERLFGTNGVRGIINVDMTSDLALQMGKAIGTVMGGTVAIATDTRISADMIKTAVSSGIMSVVVNVLDLGVLPTPAIQYYVKTHDNVKGVHIVGRNGGQQRGGGAGGGQVLREDTVRTLEPDRGHVQDRRRGGGVC